MFITYGNILLVFKHYIFQSKPCLRNTKSLFYNIVEIHRSYKNKLYSFQKCCALLQSSCTVCFFFLVFFFPVCLWMFDKAQPHWTINFWKPLNKPTHVKDWEMHTLLVAAVRLSWNWWGHPRAYSKHVLIYFLAENHLKTIITNKDASEDQYCYFFHPSTSKFFISLNWANIVLQGRNKQHLQKDLWSLSLNGDILYLQLMLCHTPGSSKITAYIRILGLPNKTQIAAQ